MKKCVLFSGGPFSDCDSVKLDIDESDFIVACDAGYKTACKFGVRPQLVVGDFDSYVGEIERGIQIERAVPEKDDTDTILGVRRALEKGCKDFLIVGAMGGRLDHTIANIQTLVFLCENGARGELRGNSTRAWVIENETLHLERMDGYISVFAIDSLCEGVTLRGLCYPLTEATLTPGFPIGVSNAFAKDEAFITVKNGRLLVLACVE